MDGFRVVLPPPDPDSPPIVIDKGDGQTTVSSPISAVIQPAFADTVEQDLALRDLFEYVAREQGRSRD